MNNYLIPANTKKGNLIFGYFRGIDLAIFTTGLLITVFLMLITSGNTTSIWMTILMFLPLFISAVLVFPLPPHYHNVLVFLQSAYKFYTSRNKYYWRGWCSNVQRKRK